MELEEFLNKVQTSERIKDINTDALKTKLKHEINRAKYAYNEGFDVYSYIEDLSKKNKLDNFGTIPYLLGFTDTISENPLEIRQIKPGDSGGLDIDTDICASGKPLIKAHLEEKYGKDHVCSIGTYTTMGIAPTIKDILRKEKVSASEANAFTKQLTVDGEKWEDTLERYKKDFPELYKTYLNHKVYLDFVPKLCNIQRSTGCHAGGILICDKPIYERIPTIKSKEGIATAFVENGGNTELDELGMIKYDVLGLSTLDIIDDALRMVVESGDKFYRIIDDDGIEKIVSSSYLREKGVLNDEGEIVEPNT